MAPVAQQAAERVLHRAGRRGEDVRLDRRQVDDVLADERLRDLDAIGEDLVEDEHLALRLVVDPDGVFIRQVDALEAVAVEDDLVLVLDLALVGIDDDGAVLDGHDLVIAVAKEGADYPFELPGGRRAGGVVVLPGDVDLESGLDVARQRLSRAGEMHGVSDVVENGGSAGIDDGDARA